MDTFKVNKKTQKKKKKITDSLKRDLQVKEEGQVYAKVLKTLGNCRLELECYDGMKRIGHIRGSMKNKTWIAVGDIVLACTRDFQDNKCDVIFKYAPEEVRKIIGLGDISTEADEKSKEIEKDDDTGFVFDDI